jgi:transcriptional regulator with XRE-family HTH domain
MFATPAEIVRSVAGKIRVLRLEAGWSQEELARRAGIAPETYKRFERTGQVSFERLVRAAVALGRADEIAAMFERAEVESIDELADEAPKRKRGRSL